MFTDTITTGTTPVTYTRRQPKGTRSIFVPVGDTPAVERRIELSNEVTAAKRVNQLVKFADTIADPVTNVATELSVAVKITRSAFMTEAQMQSVVDRMVKFLVTGNVTKLFNQEQ